MKQFLLLVLFSLSSPSFAHADGRAQYSLRATAVGCVFSAEEELETCAVVSNPVDETIVVRLERTKVKDWQHDSLESKTIYSLYVPQLGRAIDVEATVYVGRDGGSKPAPKDPYTVSAAVEVAPAPGIGHGFSSTSFRDPKGFGEFHAEGKRHRYPLPGGKSLDFSPQIDVSNLSFLD
jgi:hypothetical protein